MTLTYQSRPEVILNAAQEFGKRIVFRLELVIELLRDRLNIERLFDTGRHRRN